MALTHFPVTGKLEARISDSSADPDGDPDVQPISCFVTFTPSIRQVFSQEHGIIYRLQPIRGRTSIDDGELKTIDGNTLTLIANSPALGLPELRYKVDFSNVVYDGQRNQTIDSFSFVAPTDDTPVDLATVTRI